MAGDIATYPLAQSDDCLLSGACRRLDGFLRQHPAGSMPRWLLFIRKTASCAARGGLVRTKLLCARVAAIKCDLSNLHFVIAAGCLTKERLRLRLNALIVAKAISIFARRAQLSLLAARLSKPFTLTS